MKHTWSTTTLSLLLAAPLSLSAQTIRVSPRFGELPDRTSNDASADGLPHNWYGAHLLVDSGTGTGEKHLRWARHLVGRWGHAKTLLMNIDRKTRGPQPGWVKYVETCYRLELIPVLRLGGRMRDGQWLKPEADAPGDYTSMARAIRSVVEGLPTSPRCPLYIELWNEPNLAIEWSGQPDPREYAAFFVQAARAIHDLNNPRIRVLNGGLATSPDFAEELCKADPAFVKSFDLWSCHPYPGNRPSWINLHDKTAPPNPGHMLVDSYLFELDVLKRFDARPMRVMITETGYDLGNALYTRGEGHPIIDEYNRADYMVRAFRDLYPKWPEVAAVFPFEFCNQGWERFDWVYPDSETNADGSPTRPHYHYSAVAALAKPTDTTGAINGTVKVDGLDARLGGATVALDQQRFGSDPLGNYFLPRLKPGSYELEFSKPGFRSIKRQIRVTAGANSVINPELTVEHTESLSGTVRDGDTERPLGFARITLQPGNHKASTDGSGRYAIRGLAPIRYRLTAEASRRYPYQADGIEVVSGRTNTWDFRLGKLAPWLPEGNLLNNAGMEAGGGGAARKGIALSFEPANDRGAEEVNTEITARQAHTGRCAQVLLMQAEVTMLRQITHYNTANPGQRYLAGAWLRSATGDRDAKAWVSLEFTNNDGGLIKRFEPRDVVKGSSTEWVWVSVEGQAPPGSQRMSITFHAQGRTGTACFDDAFVGQAR